jgi:hypothetical protein
MASDGRASGRRERIVLSGLFALGLLLRFLAARGLDFWEDDIGTITDIRRITSLAEFLRASPVSGHPPLGFLFGKVAFALLGVSGRAGEELLCRAPFLIAGALAVPLAWAVARRLSEGWVPLAVAAATALSPLLLWCDRDIRGYALLAPLSLATALFWLRAQDEDRPRDWACFVAFATLTAWDHYNALPFVAALLLVGALERRDRPVRPILAGVAILALYAPWLPALREHLRMIELGRHSEQVQLHIPPVALTSPLYVLFGLVLGYTVFPWSVVVVLPVALAGAALTAAGLARARAESCWRVPLLGLALPVAGAAATTFHMPRYYVAYVPFLFLLLARGAQSLMARSRAALVLPLVLLAGVVVSDADLLLGRQYHFLYPLRPWREAAAIVRANPAPVVAILDRPFATTYVPDLVAHDPQALARSGVTAVWVLVDEVVSEPAEEATLAPFRAAGFHVTDRPLLVDADHEARERWVGRGVRATPVRLLRLER